MTNNTTGLVCHEHYFWHDTGSAAGFIPSGLHVQPDTHAENAATKRRLLGLLEVSGLLNDLADLKPRTATLDEICRFHTLGYVEQVRALSNGNGGDAGELAPVGRGSFEIASLSAGGCLTALEAIMNGQVSNAYVLNRPPGHHADSEQGRGFCIFGNGAITTKHAQAALGVGRIAIVDWDVHHGNSQETAFIDDPNVLTISIHQDNYYPAERGKVEDNGEGAGKGANINIPLPPGSGHGAYLHALDQVIAPALRRFRPELIIVSSGFDGSALDPLGRMMAYSETYRTMTASLKELAGELCDGRLLGIHEGGYSTAYVPYCGLAVMEELSGIRTEVEDPFQPIITGMGGQALQPHQADLIKKAAQLVENIPT